MMRILIFLIVIIFGNVELADCSQNSQSATDEKICFSANYEEAREKFLEASRAVGASLESFRNPNKGPDGKPLFTDVAIIGPSDAKTILVLGSGTHGVEGFTGSAIQICLLLEGLNSYLRPGMRIVLIHAINPYGFAHIRRFNEDNVDVNRNFVDHSKPYPANKGYDQLADVLAPQAMSLWNDTKLLIRLQWFRILNGTTELRTAISGGQYKHPKGLFYGGNTPTWSNKTIRMIANRYLSEANRIVIIDFHTGLGSYGDAEIIMNVKKDSPAYQRAKQWWGNIVTSTVAGDSVSANLHGTLKLAFPEMLPNSVVTAVSLEFGTLSRKEVLWAVRSENWLYHHGGSEHPDSNKIKKDLLRAFYPDQNKWKLEVWLKGKKIVEEFLDQL